MLYFVWLVVSLTLFVATQPGVADSGSGLMLRFLASLALVVIGGAVGAMLQAAVITRLFGRSLFLLWRSEQNRIGNYRLPDHDDEAHAGHVARKPVEPRAQCPECGAILAGNEAVCRRCGCEIWSDQKASEEKPRAQDAAKAALLVGEAGTEPARRSPFVPALAHRIKCPHCGAMMADSDSACVWCGHKISP
jgi:DNA-directed RNA polymerase subunit M/transcription elongation factor TFIIS